MIAICRKDLASLFHSFIGWLYLAVMWALMSLYIGSNCLIGLNSDISSVLSVSSVLMLIMLPILCMRSFAEERRSRTDQLILTAPVSVGKVVIGKYMALAILHTIVTAGLCLYPLLLSRFGTVPYAQSYTGLLGMWLFGLAETAVCVFLSSLTESVIIAAVLSFAVLFLSLVMPNLEQMISSDGNVLTSVMSVLDIPSRYDTFLNGTIDLTSFVYLASVILVFLFLTTQVIQKRRYSVSKKTLSFGAYSTGLIALVLAVAVVANLAVNRLPSDYTKIDVTSSGLYSLTSQTKEYLKELDQDATIYVLASSSDMDSMLDKTLSQMVEQSEHLTVTYVDPASNPSFLQEYSDVMSCSWNSLIVECGSRYKIVDYSDVYEYSIDYSTYTQSVSGYDAEGQVDSAIAYVTSENLPKLYVLTGHGEESIGSNFTSALKKLNCEYESLDLMVNDFVPDDCTILLINGPSTDLSSDDADKILYYVQHGGDLIITTNFQQADEMPNWNKVLNYYGLSVSKGVVLENNQGYYYRSETYLLPNVETASETSSVRSGNGYIFMAYAQALEETEATAESEVNHTSLLTTSDSAYLHSDVTTATDDFSQTSEDTTSQFLLGVKAVAGEEETEDSGSEENSDSEDSNSTDSDSADSAQADSEETEESDSEEESGTSDSYASTAYVFSSVLTFSDGADQMVSGSNSSLFSSLVSAFVDKNGSSTGISVAVKSVSSSSLTVPTMTAIIVNLFCIILIPLILLVIGFVTWFVRRRR